jgi:hypothetical protein
MTFRAGAVATILAALLPIAACRALSATDPGASPAAAPSAQPEAQPEPALPSGVSEVMKLHKGGVPADIITHFVNNSTLSFYLSADNVIYLQQQGVSPPVITAMIQRNGELQRQTPEAPQPQRAAGAPAPAVQVPAQAPAPVYYGYPPENAAANFNNALQARAANPAFYPVPAPSYPVYYPSYYDSYEYYPYAFDYWPPVVVGFGFGHLGGGFAHEGFGHGGFGGGAAGRGGFAGGGGRGGHR